MSRYQKMFQNLASKNECACIPFALLGDPSIDDSLMIIDALVEGGADALSLGIPFSEPIADGPIVQEAVLRAFEAKTTPDKCFDAIFKIRQKYPEIPIGLLMYANLVFANGITRFYKKCADVGVDSVLVMDLPMHESKPFCTVAKEHGIAPVFICPPDASDTLIKEIATNGEGYTHLISFIGQTGANEQELSSLKELTNRLKSYQAPPAVQSFGLSNVDQIISLEDSGVFGAILDSAIPQMIAQNKDQPERLRSEVLDFIKKMKQTTQKN